MFPSSSSIFLAALAAGVSAQTAGAGVYNGMTYLLGNSFGIPFENATYDYIIVGGGTAGNAVAARLATGPQKYSVAIIETGGFYEILNGNRTQVPGYDYYSALPNSANGDIHALTSFDLLTAPQAGYNGRQIHYIQGQTFGGSSASNYMGYLRTTVGTFTQWASQVGDNYWSWDNVYPTYKKSVHFNPPDYSKLGAENNISYDPSAYQSNGGPLEVSYGNYVSPWGKYLSNALDKLGFKAIPGLNSGKLIGYAFASSAVDPKTATRSSSETSFLQYAAKNSNIKIYSEALAQRILFDGNKKATGVLVQGNNFNRNFTYTLNAAKEVIVSAGNWHSPQLLMVSGIGPASVLKSKGINVIVDNPAVGQNERDQPFLAATYKVNVTTGTQILAGNPSYNAQIVKQYIENQEGPLASIGAGPAVAFEKFPSNLRGNFSKSTLDNLKQYPDDWPEVEYLPLSYGPFPSNIGPDDQYLLIGGVLCTTSSVGNMTITSSNMIDQPVISPNWLLDKGDGEQAVAALQRIRAIAANSGIAQQEFLPGSSVQTPDQILTWLRNNMNLIYHGASTCRMGASNDTNSVVDSRARVKGVKNLRVVDASAFPFLPPGQPMATVYMFAEKIAQSILDGQ